MTFDYVIVGAGSAGCVLAHRLSEDAMTSVLLIEAGDPADEEAVHHPSGWLGLVGSERDWGYLTVPQEQLNQRPIYWPRGKMLGGSSSLNLLNYARGAPQDYDDWRVPDWSYDELLPYFKKAECNTRKDPELYGHDGPLSVREQRAPSLVTQAFLAAAESAGFEQNPNFGAGPLAGAGTYQVTLKDGRRQSTAQAYLRPILDRENLTCWTNSKARRVRIKQGRAEALEVCRGGETTEVIAERELLLCAGVIESPKLLLLSGLGPADELRRLGIEPVLDLPEVGKHLQDHPMLAVGYLAASELGVDAWSNLGEAGLILDADMGLNFGAFLAVSPSYRRPDPGYAIIATLLRPKSRGTVGLTSPDPEAPLRIDPNYLQDPEDLDKLLQALEWARRLGRDPAFAPFRKEEIAAEESALDYLRAATESHSHPVGTCRLGSVLDSELKVRGISGLRVVDASIMPALPSAPINAATIAIAEKAADLIRAKALL